jgi:hypothetical protein
MAVSAAEYGSATTRASSLSEPTAAVACRAAAEHCAGAHAGAPGGSRSVLLAQRRPDQPRQLGSRVAAVVGQPRHQQRNASSSAV